MKASGSGFSNTNHSKDDKKPKPPFKRGKGMKGDLDRMKHLHNEKWCFECKSLEHMVKDCPECIKNQIHYREVLWTLALAKLHGTVLLPFDDLQHPIVDPYAKDRFSFMEWGGIDTYLLRDEHDGDEHVLYYSDLVDPEFDLLHWLFTEKAKFFDELLQVHPSTPSNGSPSDRSISGDISDDNFDDNFGYNSPWSGSEWSGESDLTAGPPPLVSVDTDNSGASDTSSYVIDVDFEDPNMSSEGEWITSLVHKLEPENRKNHDFSCVSPLPRHIQVNYT